MGFNWKICGTNLADRIQSAHSVGPKTMRASGRVPDSGPSKAPIGGFCSASDSPGSFGAPFTGSLTTYKVLRLKATVGNARYRRLVPVDYNRTASSSRLETVGYIRFRFDSTESFR